MPLLYTLILLPVAANSTHGACIVDGDPGIRLQSAGLLQLGTQRHHREPFSTLAVGAERSSQAHHADRTALAHHSCLATTSLAACSTLCGIQAGILVYKASTRLAPTYLSDDCLLVAEVGRRLRSTDERTLCCNLYRGPWTQFGDRSFDVAGPRVWNSLPAPLRDSDTNSIYSIRKQLKTFLFSGGCRV